MSRLIADTSGSTLVEVSLLAPMLMVLWIGAMQFAPLLQSRLILQQAVHQGVQTISSGRTDSNVYSDALNAVNTAAGSMATSVTASLFVCNVSGGSCTACSASGGNSCATLLQSAAGNAVKITATYPCSLTFALFGLGPSCTLSATESGIVQ